MENLMTLAQDAFVNKVRRLPSLPPSLPSFLSMHLHISFSPSHLINLPPSLPPSFLPQVNDPAKVSATVAKMASSSDPTIQVRREGGREGGVGNARGWND